MKKILCVILSVLLLTFTFAACDGGSSGNGDRINNFTGEIKADGLNNFSIGVFTGEDGKERDRKSLDIDENSYEDFVRALAQGNRIMSFRGKIKGIKEFDGKKLTKISFDIEADRDVSSTLSIENAYTNQQKTINLTENSKQSVAFEFDASIKPDGLFWSFTIASTPDGEIDYEADTHAEWSQTQYKITNLKIYCE